MRSFLALMLMLFPGSLRLEAQRTPVTQPSRAAELARLREQMPDLLLPPGDSVARGGRVVAGGVVHDGTVAVVDGPLEIRGMVRGSAVALGGDVILGPGGRVTGQAVSIGGRVRMEGGVVEGEARTLDRVPDGVPTRAGGSRVAAVTSPLDYSKMVVGWFAVLFVLGVGILVAAESNLEGVVREMERHLSRSFWAGVAAQLAALPVLLMLCVGLVLTVVGILLVPFAVVAYMIVVAGLLALGFLAVARMTGAGLLRANAGGAPRVQHLRALFAGLLVYVGLWLVAALGGFDPLVGAILRAVALAVTWAATTVGLGAVILSRAGTQRSTTPRRGALPSNDMSWQTPTPVAGVAAARRPVPTVSDAR